VYDAIIVGARCAGSPLAMLLARKGYKVLLTDKASFPSDIISTHYIHQPGAARLKRWGLLDAVMSSNCPPIKGLLFDLGPFALEGSAPSVGGVLEALCPRRTVLDKILLDAAAAAGAEVRERFYVRDVIRDGDRVAGIRAETATGHSLVEQARVVVGADGQRSVIARACGAAEYQVRPAASCNYYTYFSDVPCSACELYNRDRCLIGLFPTNDDLTLLVESFPIHDFHEQRGNLEAHYFRLLTQVPELSERVRGGRREARFAGTTDLPGFFRKSSGPGWALAGDAGYHKHPVTAQGISDAFRDADELAAAIDAGLSGAGPLEESLADYARRRDESVMPMYELTCEMATLDPPSLEMQHRFAAMRGDQEAISRFLGMLAGSVGVAEFLSRHT
jgi:2-polyprenyl-6-methoxyphenol hydroxylase-like FAD-dependent oxidoreductase